MKVDKVAFLKVDGALYHLYMRPRKFKTGSIGFYCWGKVLVDGKKHQVMANIVEIGSKDRNSKDN